MSVLFFFNLKMETKGWNGVEHGTVWTQKWFQAPKVEQKFIRGGRGIKEGSVTSPVLVVVPLFHFSPREEATKTARSELASLKLGVTAAIFSLPAAGTREGRKWGAVLGPTLSPGAGGKFFLPNVFHSPIWALKTPNKGGFVDLDLGRGGGKDQQVDLFPVEPSSVSKFTDD